MPGQKMRMNAAQDRPPRERERLAADGVELATVHALGWLAVACGVGLLLSVLLVAPGLGKVLGSLPHGRWMLLHGNLVLYGWLALPLVALLFRAVLSTGTGRTAEMSVQVWSGSLMVGAVGWLTGETTGKAFLDGPGVTRVVFLLSLMMLAWVLAAGLVDRWRTHSRSLQLRAWRLPRFEWPDGSRPWLLAFLAWGGGTLLARTLPMFLPGFLAGIQLANALVAHAHLATAGAASSFAALILVVVNDRTRLRGCLADRGSFALWHGGNAVHVAALAGSVEALAPGAITACYVVRALAGAAMLAAAWRWTAEAVRRIEASRVFTPGLPAAPGSRSRP
jgi:hypothetical protein